ncbi:MAG: hypothetical protein J0L82_17000 [Deltaproteobacteria bacterium]|nr:hypothetical protein [Deltaproteobacteria bacterium]
MKTLMMIAMTLIASNASAISFITEEDVQKTLGAEKVIEISKYTVLEKLVEKSSDCEATLFSRSARAYVVKMNGKSLLVVTRMQYTKNRESLSSNSPRSTGIRSKRPRPTLLLRLRPLPRLVVRVARMRYVTTEGQRPVAINVARMRDIGAKARSAVA